MSISCAWGDEVKLNIVTLLDEATVSGSDYTQTALELGFNLDTGAYMFAYSQTVIINNSPNPITDKKLFKYNPETGIVSIPTFSAVKRYVTNMGGDIDDTAVYMLNLHFKTANANLQNDFASFTVQITASSEGNVSGGGGLPGTSEGSGTTGN